MTPDKDRLLVENFPNLYRQRHLGMRQTAMCWGFECGDGWYDILWRLSAKLEKMILEMPEDEREGFSAIQVKEKYGTLRFYMTCSTDKMEEAIREAERESARTCETCGDPGHLFYLGWCSTRCPRHIEAAVIITHLQFLAKRASFINQAYDVLDRVTDSALKRDLQPVDNNYLVERDCVHRAKALLTAMEKDDV